MLDHFFSILLRLNRHLNNITFLILVLFFGCKSQTDESSLENKISEAVKSRKIPDINSQNVTFNPYKWGIERGAHSTEIFNHFEEYLPTILIEKGNTATNTLDENFENTLGQEVLTSGFFKKETSLDQICNDKHIDGIIILHKGQIVYEKYPDMKPTDRHFLGSVTKSFTGTIIANLVDQNLLNEQDSIGKFLEEFKGKPLAKVTVQNLLRMASGIDCRENEIDSSSKKNVSITDPNHCFYKLLQHTALFPEPNSGNKEALMNVMANAGIYKEQGEVYDYTSANSLILAAIAERISHKPYHELIEEYIWQKIGAESDARTTMSSKGIAGSYGSMMMRLRDLARYGLAFTSDASNRIASDRYLKEITIGDKQLFQSKNGYGEKVWTKLFQKQGPLFQSYHWDVVFDDNDFVKFGLGGQGLYISPKKRLVIAFFSSKKDTTKNNLNMRYLVRSVALLEKFKE